MLLCVALLVCLSAAAGRSWVGRRLVRVAASRGLEIENPDRLSLSWRGEVVIDRVAWSNESVAVSAAVVRLRPDWSALARGELRVAGLVVEDLRLHVSAGFGLPPAEWSAARAALAPSSAGESSWQATVELADGGTLSGVVSTGEQAWVDLTIAGVSHGSLPSEWTATWPWQVRATANGALQLGWDRTRGSARVCLAVVSDDLTVTGARLAEVPVGPSPSSLFLAAHGDAAEWVVDGAELSSGPTGEARVQLSGRVARPSEALLQLELALQVSEMADLVGVLPTVLRPPVAAPALAGALIGAARVSGPRSRPLEWTVDGNLDLSAMRAAAQARQPSPLASQFIHRSAAGDGNEREVVVGPDNPEFVAIAELPTWVVDAVLTSEDAGFLRHAGFDFDEIKKSVVAVAEAGRAVRGGSTISQQLAKNLFLSREKTYARKAREALITLGLESSLSKERMLEIYLNIIEWGPGIYGIREAARVYFDKEPAALTPREAVLLASVIPSPLRYYAARERGEVRPEWEARQEFVLTRMNERGLLSPESFSEAISAPSRIPIHPVQ